MNMFYLIKHTLESLCQPFTLGMLLLVVGTLLLMARRHVKAGTGVISCGLLVLLLFSYPPMPGLLYRSLSSRYQPITKEVLREMPGHSGEVVWIAVLSGGFYTNGATTVGARLNEASLIRFAEAIRIYRQIPEAKILFSVSDIKSDLAQKRLLDQLAGTFGLPRDDLDSLAGAKTTQDEAGMFRGRLGTTPFILVTSDYHMPRAMLLFKGSGLNPVPAPVGQCGQGDPEPRFNPSGLFPSDSSLSTSHTVIHEYLGIIWAWVAR